MYVYCIYIFFKILKTVFFSNGADNKASQNEENFLPLV